MYLHLDYNNSTEIMAINFLFTFRLQHNHGHYGNYYFIFTFTLQNYHGDCGNQINFTLRLLQYHEDDRI